MSLAGLSDPYYEEDCLCDPVEAQRFFDCNVRDYSDAEGSESERGRDQEEGLGEVSRIE